MDNQLRQKLLLLYNATHDSSTRRRMEHEFPELFDNAVRLTSFRLSVDPGKLLSQDGTPLMEVTYEGNKIRLTEQFNWRLHTNVNGTQILWPEKKGGC